MPYTNGTKWYLSKTLWAAAITGVLGVITVVIGEGLVSPEVAGGILVGVSILQGVLRMLTTGPVRL
jgi:uncharacterized membrane protein